MKATKIWDPSSVLWLSVDMISWIRRFLYPALRTSRLKLRCSFSQAVCKFFRCISQYQQAGRVRLCGSVKFCENFQIKDIRNFFTASDNTLNYCWKRLLQAERLYKTTLKSKKQKFEKSNLLEFMISVWNNFVY